MQHPQLLRLRTTVFSIPFPSFHQYLQAVFHLILNHACQRLCYISLLVDEYAINKYFTATTDDQVSTYLPTDLCT